MNSTETPNSTPIQTPEAIISHGVERWNHCDGLEEATIIRLAILRDLTREMHAEKSRYLALGKKTEAQGFKGIEKAMDELRGAGPLEGDLRGLLSGEIKPRKRTRLLPESLFSFIPKDKFERHDRIWESAIAAEAASLGWCFWRLEAWVSIAQVEDWQRALSSELMPHGVILFAESGSQSVEGGVPSDALADLWQGCWVIVLKSRYRTPDFHVNQLPGSSQIPRPPEWKLLFSPRVR